MCGGEDPGAGTETDKCWMYEPLGDTWTHVADLTHEGIIQGIVQLNIDDFWILGQCILLKDLFLSLFKVRAMPKRCCD